MEVGHRISQGAGSVGLGGCWRGKETELSDRCGSIETVGEIGGLSGIVELIDRQTGEFWSGELEESAIGVQLEVGV